MGIDQYMDQGVGVLPILEPDAEQETPVEENESEEEKPDQSTQTTDQS